jgi:sirohydrochlorin cobaltochelatase
MGVNADRLGIILLAHGSRDARWREPFDSLASKVEGGLQNVAVRVAFLKDLEPDIYMAVGGLARSGVTHVMVVPVFLAIGGHSANDFPVMAGRLCAAHPAVKFRWTEALGSWEEVVTAMAGAICAKAAEAS